MNLRPIILLLLLVLLLVLLLAPSSPAQQYIVQPQAGQAFVVQQQRAPKIIRLPMVIPTPYYKGYKQAPLVSRSRDRFPEPAPQNLGPIQPLVIENPYFTAE